MAQLEEERAELVQWQALDKARRGLQYALYDADLADAAERLREVRSAAVRAQARLTQAATSDICSADAVCCTRRSTACSTPCTMLTWPKRCAQGLGELGCMRSQPTWRS